MAKKVTIPRKEDELIALAKQAKQAFIEDGAGYGFNEEEIEILIGAVDEFQGLRDDHRKKQNAVRTARVTKDLSQKKLKKILGNYIKRMRARTDLTAAKLVKFGVQPTDTTRTPVDAPETAPEFNISYANMQHTLQIWEEGSIRRRRKPYGVVGAEIYQSFDADKNNLDAYKLCGMAFKSRYTVKYEWDDAGKQVHYYLKWVTRRDERSPMSRIESATITTLN